jgi:hypothetical protein
MGTSSRQSFTERSMILRSNLPKLREFGGRSARVLDAGGWYRPFNLATHVIDVNPYESRRVDDALDPKTTSVLLPIPGSDKAPPSPTRSRKLKFAIDSALEGDGFEPSVRRQIRSRFESRSASHDRRFEAASPCGSLWRELYKAS